MNNSRFALRLLCKPVGLMWNARGALARAVNVTRAVDVYLMGVATLPR